MDRPCLRVIIGADASGNTDVPGLICGFRQSTRSWREMLLALNRRSAKRNAGGREAAPRLAVADGAIGFRCHRVLGPSGFGAIGFWAALHAVPQDPGAALLGA